MAEQKKLDGYADEEPRNVSAAECDDIVSSCPKRKREQPKKLVDHEQNTPANSPMSEESTDDDHEIALDDLLDTLHTAQATEVSSNVSQPPPTVCHWSQPHNDSCIRKYFKMRRCVVDPEEFIVRHHYKGAKEVYEYEKSDARGLTAVQDFFAKCTSCIDTTETELFLPSASKCGPENLGILRSRLYERIISQRLKLFNTADNTTSSTCRDEGNFSIDYSMFNSKDYTLGRMSHWLQAVANAVKLSPSDVDETVYVEVFKRYLEVFHLTSIIGKGSKLGIPYRNTKVSSEPDLIIRRDQLTSRFFGVVEVKKMTLDPTLKHAYEEPPKHGILNASGEGLTPSKKRCVNFPEGAPAASATGESVVEDKFQVADLGGTPLTNSQRLFIKLFFGQLFGHVLALDCCSPFDLKPHGCHAGPQRLGIGVVGFRVVFFSFSPKPTVPMKEVPCVGSHRMDVYMTSELSLLKASDRKEITKILLALSTSDPA